MGVVPEPVFGEQRLDFSQPVLFVRQVKDNLVTVRVSAAVPLDAVFVRVTWDFLLVSLELLCTALSHHRYYYQNQGAHGAGNGKRIAPAAVNGSHFQYWHGPGPERILEQRCGVLNTPHRIHKAADAGIGRPDDAASVFQPSRTGVG